MLLSVFAEIESQFQQRKSFIDDRLIIDKVNNKPPGPMNIEYEPRNDPEFQTALKAFLKSTKTLLQSTTEKPEPNSFSADEFAASENGTIACKVEVDTDCPVLSEEELFFKLQLDRSRIKEGKGCKVFCNTQLR